MSKEKLWNRCSITLILLGIALILVKGILPETIDASGILHEHFYLFDFAGMAMILLAVTLISVKDLVLEKKKGVL